MIGADGGSDVVDELFDLELDLLTEGVWRRNGVDFRNYARASLQRRVRALVAEEGAASITDLLARLLHEPACLERLCVRLSIQVTTMFRDPTFFMAFRDEVLPTLRTSPFIRIWHAGCATGEEVYSMAILLAEAGLYDRSRLYATDMNAAALDQAKAGRYPADRLPEFEENYLRAGGQACFSKWFSLEDGHATIKASLRKNIVFSQHNLTTDGSFNAFNAILCRNVLIYFNPDLQSRVHTLLHGSLQRFGYLALGRGESLTGTSVRKAYQPIAIGESIFRRRA